jgi:nucleoside-specific outer membrane channel protein Tsx
MVLRLTRIILTASAGLLLHAPVYAGEFFQFSDTSISALTGWGFELPGDHMSAFTLENANSWVGGDFYGFVDFRNQHDHPTNKHTWYGEVSPRFSLEKIGGLNFGEGLVKDVLVATTWERGEAGNESYLIGAGVSLDLPGFSFFKANLYARKDKSRGANFDDTQFTFAWAYPFKIGNNQFVINGISDYVFGNGPRERNWHFVPQLKWDAGALRGKPRKYYLGLEFDYWDNQFGVKNSAGLDTRQFSVSLLLRMHL